MPVALVYNGISHVVIMASPKELEAFAIGFSLSESIIASPADIYGIDILPAGQGLEVQVELSSRCFMALKAQHQALDGRTGCGICCACSNWTKSSSRCRHDPSCSIGP